MSAWQQLLKTFTKECDNVTCGVKKGKTGYFSCWRCNGRGMVLTEDGLSFLAFIKVYGDFAEKDHSHHLS